MQAIVQDRYGGPEVLRLAELEPPVPGEGRVAVRVRAAAVNPADWHLMRGSPFFVRLTAGIRRPKRPVLGSDVAGVVEAVGPGVTSVRPGEEVVGFAGGSVAELALARADRLVPKPSTLTWEQAAGLPMAGVTALQGLRDHGRVEAGQRVLVIGASGGVGTLAVQVAKALGAEVTGVCSTRNVDLVRSLGADHVVDYTRDDVTRAAGRYDVILQLAGTASPGSLRRALAPHGVLLLSSGEGRAAGVDRIVRAAVTSPFVGQRLAPFLATSSGSDLAALVGMVEAGAVRPVVDRTYPIGEAAEAIRYLETGRARGKVVITI